MRFSVPTDHKSHNLPAPSFDCLVDRLSRRPLKHQVRHVPPKTPRLPLSLRRRESAVLGLQLEFDVLAASQDAIEVTLAFDAGAQEDLALLDTVNLAAEETEMGDATWSRE
jgi:hypothetical protein